MDTEDKENTGENNKNKKSGNKEYNDDKGWQMTTQEGKEDRGETKDTARVKMRRKVHR